MRKSLGKTLHRLFREALNAGKTARSQTRIGNESVSIATAAIEAAKTAARFACEASVVGHRCRQDGHDRGETAARRGRRAASSSPTARCSRAQDVIAEVGFGEAIEMPGLVDAIAAADIVVTSTGASHFILTTENVVEAMAQRPERPLVIVDIAVPRDADPAVAAIPERHVWSISTA